VRPTVKFWGSLAILLAGEAVFTFLYRNSGYWDTHIFYCIGIVLFGLWLFYVMSLVVKGPLFAAPGIMAFCLAILALLMRFELVCWQAMVLYFSIAIAYFAIVVWYDRR